MKGKWNLTWRRTVPFGTHMRAGYLRPADKINDTYLKANGQADGVQSYSRMVDLIVAYFEK